jgi:hypothetical protein
MLRLALILTGGKTTEFKGKGYTVWEICLQAPYLLGRMNKCLYDRKQSNRWTPLSQYVFSPKLFGEFRRIILSRESYTNQREEFVLDCTDKILRIFERKRQE